MPLYRYRVVDETGSVQDGEMEAADRDVVVERLRRQGRLVVRADPAGGAVLPVGLAAALNRDLFGARGPSARQTACMLRELATLLKAGLPLDRALEIIAALGGSGAAARVAADLVQRVRGGAALADAMEAQGPSLPRFAVGMVRAGESAGALEVVVARLADFMERSQIAREQLASALIYPLVLLIAAIGTVAMLLGVVLPQFRPLFQQAGRELPLLTRMVISAGDFAALWWWVLPLGAVALMVLLARRSRDRGLRLILDRWVLTLPVLGRLVAEIEVARLLRALGTLLANGVPLLNALTILAGTVNNAAVGEAVESAVGSLRQGRTLAEPLARLKWFPPVAARLLAVGEEIGRLDELVTRAADLLDFRVQRLMERGLALLGPAMILVLGVVVAAVVAAILLAVLQVDELVM